MTLDIITSDALAPFAHGFFGRAGGASSGIFQGLNCGRGSSDQPDAVALNRARVANALGVEGEALKTVHQVHSVDVVTVGDAFSDTTIKADAMVTKTSGVCVSILTADCMPVLFADAKARVIGAAHAGWKGALGGVLEATIDAMEALGAARGNIAATIGPAISQRAYEVGPEFYDRIVDADPEHARFFVGGAGDRVQFDLPGFGLFRLRKAGVGQAGWTRHCTYSDPDRFFSYRRSVHQREADYGRLISAIVL